MKGTIVKPMSLKQAQPRMGAKVGPRGGFASRNRKTSQDFRRRRKTWHTKDPAGPRAGRRRVR